MNRNQDTSGLALKSIIALLTLTCLFCATYGNIELGYIPFATLTGLGFIGFLCYCLEGE